MQVLFPRFDESNDLLYLFAKGDLTVRFYEYQNDSINYINEFRDKDGAKAFCFFPKYVVDTNKKEIMRFAKIFSNHVRFVSFIYPRKVIHYNFNN